MVIGHYVLLYSVACTLIGFLIAELIFSFSELSVAAFAYVYTAIKRHVPEFSFVTTHSQSVRKMSLLTLKFTPALSLIVTMSSKVTYALSAHKSKTCSMHAYAYIRNSPS